MSSFTSESFHLWGQRGRCREKRASISPVMIFQTECLEYQGLTIWGFRQIIATVSIPVTFIHSATVGGSCSVAGAELSPGSREGWRGSWVGGWVGIGPVVLNFIG